MAGRQTSIKMLKYGPDTTSHRAGDIIFREGTVGTHFYVVKSGTVELKVGGQTIETLQSGDILGEMALLDGETRSATAVAVSDCELVPINNERFVYLVKQTPYFALEVMQIMARRLRHMNQSAHPGAKA